VGEAARHRDATKSRNTRSCIGGDITWIFSRDAGSQIS